jgi:hypothetical protein
MTGVALGAGRLLPQQHWPTLIRIKLKIKPKNNVRPRQTDPGGAETHAGKPDG